MLAIPAMLTACGSGGGDSAGAASCIDPQRKIVKDDYRGTTLRENLGLEPPRP